MESSDEDFVSSRETTRDREKRRNISSNPCAQSNSEQGTSAADWVIYDSERNKFNPSGKQLYPNRNIAEADDSNHQFDILSNGFKVRSTSTSDLTNATDKYIYCAWAASPSVDLFGGGANAR